MGDERSGCGSGSGTLVTAPAALAAAAVAVVEPPQQQQQQQNFEQHLQQQQQHIICGKCRGNNSTIWTIPCVSIAEHSRNFPFFENKINNQHTHTHTWNGKVPASVGGEGGVGYIRDCVFTLPHKYYENIGWQITWISFW